MKSITIVKTKKTVLVSPVKVRALLKRNGIKVGHWSANGRISGLYSFHGGDVEVREVELSWKVETEKKSERVWIHKNIKIHTAGVITKDKEKQDAIVKLLEDNGMKSTIDELYEDVIIVK